MIIAEPVSWNNRLQLPPKIILPVPYSPKISPFIRSEHAFRNGDRILARILSCKENKDLGSQVFEGEVIKYLPSTKKIHLGIFHFKGNAGGVITPVHKKETKYWNVLKGDEANSGDGDLVRFEPLYKNNSGKLKARVVEVLGNPTSQRQVSIIAIHTHGLANEFSKNVLDELNTLPALSKCWRTDMRDLQFITIDPEDARDYDDAIHASYDQDPTNIGGWIVTVAVADVAYYVRPGTALDDEAYRRSNSVYFPDRVVPMLPDIISNNLCSLREAENRPCLAVRMVFDKYGAKRQHTFYRGLIRVAMNLSYEQAQQIFDGSVSSLLTSQIYKSVLQPIWLAYIALMRTRQQRCPLELDLPERRVSLNETGQVDRVIVPRRLDSHRLIEEFMIQANVSAAETLEKGPISPIYRVHPLPSREKLHSFREFLHTLGLELPVQDNIRAEIFNNILATTKSQPVVELLNEVILRTQAQAEYTLKNYGHFGLNLKSYTHFTSPIRRYSDLITHRSIIRSLKLGPGGLTDTECSELHLIAAHISQMERRSMAAERETIDRLIAKYLSEQIGAEFDARISGFIKSGVFIRLVETGSDGFIPVSSLRDDYYNYVASQHAMIGNRHSLMYRLGDNVRVRLIETLPIKGSLRFEMLSPGNCLLDKKKSRKSHKISDP